MAKEYQMIGVLPIVVSGYGRVAPGNLPEGPKFQCEMEPEQEAFFLKIGAVKVVRVLPADAKLPEPAYKKDPWPTSYPKLKKEQEDQGEIS